MRGIKRNEVCWKLQAGFCLVVGNPADHRLVHNEWAAQRWTVPWHVATVQICRISPEIFITWKSGLVRTSHKWDLSTLCPAYCSPAVTNTIPISCKTTLDTIKNSAIGITRPAAVHQPDHQIRATIRHRNLTTISVLIESSFCLLNYAWHISEANGNDTWLRFYWKHQIKRLNTRCKVHQKSLFRLITGRFILFSFYSNYQKIKWINSQIVKMTYSELVL